MPLGIVLPVTHGVANIATSDYRALVEAERTFAAYGVLHSIKDAFGRFLASAFLCRENQFMLGGLFYATQSERPGRLTWQSTYPHIAASGELGYTLGYLDYEQQYGHYLRVWQHDGSQWRLALELLAAELK